jgi:hypothetical protein
VQCQPLHHGLLKALRKVLAPEQDNKENKHARKLKLPQD